MCDGTKAYCLTLPDPQPIFVYGQMTSGHVFLCFNGTQLWRFCRAGHEFLSLGRAKQSFARTSVAILQGK
jgi:hypothetical protein